MVRLEDEDFKYAGSMFYNFNSKMVRLEVKLREQMTLAKLDFNSKMVRLEVLFCPYYCIF